MRWKPIAPMAWCMRPQTREQARGDLIDRWDRDRQASPDRSRIILTHTNDEVRALNEAARERMRAAGDLGDEVRLTVERGARSFASGDRVMFLQNERGLGVKNGTLGTIEQVSAQSMTVQTDDGRSVRFDLKDYNRIDHGYAATIHKAQGMTVDRTHVLATPGMDAHGSYVALSRHRDGMDLHYGRDDFANQDRLTRTLSRDRAKDMASDYERADPAQSYAERRGITFRERVAEIVRKVVPEKVRNMFDGLRPSAEAVPGPDDARRPEREAPERKVAEDPEAALRKARTKALVRHARAVDAIFEVQERGGKASPEQVKELQEARKVFEEVRPYGSHDAEAAYKKNPELVREAAGGQVNRAIRALQLETELRTDPSRRADRFVERWQKLDQSQPASVSGGRHVRLQVDALGDGRHGQKPRTRSATGIHPRQPQAGTRHRVRIRPPARPGIGLHPRHRPRQRPGHRNLTHPIFRRLYASATATCKIALARLQLPVLSGLSSRQKQPAGGRRGHARTRPYHPFENRPRPDRAVPVHHLPQDRRGHVPGPAQDQHQRDAGWHESDINRWIADPVSWRPKREFDESGEVGG